jgi:hypothetical protein
MKDDRGRRVSTATLKETGRPRPRGLVPASAPRQSRRRSGNLGRITNCMTRKGRLLSTLRPGFIPQNAWSLKYEGGWKGRRKVAFFIVAADDAAPRQRFVWTDFARRVPIRSASPLEFIVDRATGSASSPMVSPLMNVLLQTRPASQARRPRRRSTPRHWGRQGSAVGAAKNRERTVLSLTEVAIWKIAG